MDVDLLNHLVENRRNPSRSSYDYLHLVDLRDALSHQLRHERGLWLDFGTIVSPYAALMPNATVETADLVSDAPEDLKPTYEFEIGEKCPAPDAHFDGLISTQVLEHVDTPANYLHEAHRMLRPGGRIVLSTHGIWEDHPSPGDYHRWTTQGLRRLLEEAGFAVDEVVPITCGIRALSVLTLAYLRPLPWNSDSRTFRARMKILDYASLAVNSLLSLRQSDRFGTEGAIEGHSRLYVDVVVRGHKPR
ncbi:MULTISPECIES: methyltransferase domain-containing protein [unclassified Streptomyces]|uniref:methyltransferase domain-containing protein n=1 Tax=unclassified Streptomyces TaxID=2593676 RepID=UPI00224FCA29|nr:MULTISPECIES: methyltransferase domain-containing protein [unclassified Streptomyces]MCX5053060.1 methyltransferase domain-containing protein [Streptomyces sp. NBC_00474]